MNTTTVAGMGDDDTVVEALADGSEKRQRAEVQQPGRHQAGLAAAR
jgi:hypothetical protein